MNKEMLSRDLDVAKKHDLLVLNFINTVPALPKLSSEQQTGLVKYSRIRRHPKETIVFEGDENQE
jgi:hypothetical protein